MIRNATINEEMLIASSGGVTRKLRIGRGLLPADGTLARMTALKCLYTLSINRKL
mgnify:CR=1 FL=1